MPRFDTPAPVGVVLNLMFGQVRIVAGDQAETTVRAYPRDGDDQDDVRAAEQLRVEYADGRLLVNAPEPGGSTGAVVLALTVPTGSSLHGRGAAADFLGVGELGECRLSTGLGHITLDRAGSLRLKSSLGDITVGHATGSVEARANGGDVSLGRVEGEVTVTATGEGDAHVEEAHGVARLRTERGAIRIGRAHTDVEARTGQGDIDLAEVARGTVLASTTLGSIRIGVAAASTARLSLDSAAGTVCTALSLLESSDRTDGGEGGEDEGEAGDVVRVQARTVIGDITVERS